MKLITTNSTNSGAQKTQTGTTLRSTCAACYQKVLAQITAAKEMILTESRLAVTVPERLIQLALNEAEALAWQTTYPHLVFPTLATEKIQAAAAWNAQQQSIRRSSPVFAHV